MKISRMNSGEPNKVTQVEVVVSSESVKNPVPSLKRENTSDPLALYTRDVVQFPLLAAEEEAELARKVQAGDDEARQKMILANLRLVIKIAREYENLGLPLLDLINEGNLGLMRAVERFDPEKGAKLSTYSSWWIKQKIRHALSDQSRTIRIPINAMDQAYHIRKMTKVLTDELGREPAEEEIAEKVGLSVRRVKALKKAFNRGCSLDAPIGDAEGKSFAEILPDENAVDPSEFLGDSESISRVMNLLDRLPERQAAILRARFGLDGEQERTLEDIGDSLGVTRERIRQLQNIALARLRTLLAEGEEFVTAA